MFSLNIMSHFPFSSMMATVLPLERRFFLVLCQPSRQMVSSRDFWFGVQHGIRTLSGAFSLECVWLSLLHVPRKAKRKHCRNLHMLLILLKSSVANYVTCRLSVRQVPWDMHVQLIRSKNVWCILTDTVNQDVWLRNRIVIGKELHAGCRFIAFKS